MTEISNPENQVGVTLAHRLGLQTDKQEGHDLAGPCIACKSSDAFRLHQQTGVAQCYSCGGKWSPFQMAEAVLGNREQAKSVMVELGIFQPSAGNNGDAAKLTSAPPDPTETISRQKGVPPESLRAYGTKAISPYTVRLPAYGPDGSACTTMSMSVRGGKGMFAKGKPAGLFFPHEDGKVRLPKADETWHVVEGPKDAAALHGLGLLACGLNTCRLAAKFGRLFKDVDVILIPDRDRAGEEGAEHSARVLRNVALSTQIAVLPAEFKDGLSRSWRPSSMSMSMLPLPKPKRGGRVDELRGFLNVDDSTWTLVVAWLVTALRPNVRFPVLALFAEQGSGKSTTGRLLRELVDPNAAPLRAEPRDARDLMIAANNSWCLVYDNLSYVPSWLSDALCRLSTGGGFATRELYTDQDEVIFDAMRPVLLTSIEEVATRSDLLDRCVIVWLPAIPEDRRRPEAELIEAFRKARPRIFGALLDAVAGALRDLPTTEVSGLPRMADFALWATAAESALGWSKGTFMAAYNGNRASANDLALESSTIARPLLDLLEERGEWCGSASELLEVLEPRVTDQIKRQKSWPKNGRSMAGHLKRLSPNLRAAGWEVEYQRQASQRLWSIRRLAALTSSDSFASQSAPGSEPVEDENEVQSDANRCKLPLHDADDANDANPGTPTAASAGNGCDWEEGDL